MGTGRQIMKSRLIQITLLFLLTVAPTLARAADPVDSATITAAQSSERLSWQRVGAPDQLPA